MVGIFDYLLINSEGEINFKIANRIFQISQIYHSMKNRIIGHRDGDFDKKTGQITAGEMQEYRKT